MKINKNINTQKSIDDYPLHKNPIPYTKVLSITPPILYILQQTLFHMPKPHPLQHNTTLHQTVLHWNPIPYTQPISTTPKLYPIHQTLFFTPSETYHALKLREEL